MTVHAGCDDYYTRVISLASGQDEFVSHPAGIVRSMNRHLLPGAFADAALLALTLVLLYVTVLAAATFAPA